MKNCKIEQKKNIFSISYPKEKTTHLRRNNIVFAYPIYSSSPLKSTFAELLRHLRIYIHIFVKQLLKKEATNVTGRKQRQMRRLDRERKRTEWCDYIVISKNNRSNFKKERNSTLRVTFSYISVLVKPVHPQLSGDFIVGVFHSPKNINSGNLRTLRKGRAWLAVYASAN